MTRFHLTLIVGFALGGPVFEAQTRYTAAPVLIFEHRGQPPMYMPTDVAVASDRSVFVADGVNDRVLHFSPDGQLLGEIQNVGGERISGPVGLDVDSQDRLWIAGGNRALLRDRDGELLRVVQLPSGEGSHPSDLTDVLAGQDGETIWLVDNDNHRVARVDRGEADPIFVGREGSALDQFNYPFMLARGRDGDVLVTDVINARVQLLSSTGKVRRSIAGFGIEAGDLYRPKGVACSSDGRVWISDGTMGVVQVFEPSGQFVEVLRKAEGTPFHLDSPMGLTFDSDGFLYVVELRAHRVLQLRIESEPAPRAHPLGRGDAPSAAQAQACTVCHLEWMPFSEKGRANQLIDRPISTARQPWVSQADTCLSCHDASVVDSRRKVWQEHGHRTGVSPPGSMQVPDDLPLVDGRVECRTCHSAHASGQPQGDMRAAIFLRRPNAAGELCVACHADKVRGPEFGTHPVGGMPWAIPESLIAAGARSGPNPRELTCLVCHTPHGARQDHLLVMGTESNQLCLSCHARLRPALWRPDREWDHPQNPPLSSEAQRLAIVRMGTKVGPGDTLICLSCHKLHHGQSGRYLLADTQTDSRLCLQCHEEKTHLVGSRHDLRHIAPDERNLLGQTPAQSGPCGTCHSFHHLVRQPRPAATDVTGVCTSCHSEGQCAASAPGTPMAHPIVMGTGRAESLGAAPVFTEAPHASERHIACLTCHDPHAADHPHFARTERPQATCFECHGQTRYVGMSMHGASALTASSAEIGAGSPDWTCGPCHAVHPPGSVERVRMWTGPLGPKDDPEDVRRCMGCHGPGGTGGAVRAREHPPVVLRQVSAPDSPGLLPLIDHRGQIVEMGRISCLTCHLPHGRESSHAALTAQTVEADLNLLRAAKPMLRGYIAPNLCSSCHGFEGLRRFLYFHDWRE